MFTLTVGERHGYCVGDSLLEEHMRIPSELKSELHFIFAEFTRNVGLNSKLDRVILLSI